MRPCTRSTWLTSVAISFPATDFSWQQVPVFSLLVGATVAGSWSLLNRPRVRDFFERFELSPAVLAGAAAATLAFTLNRAWELGQERGPFTGVIKTWRTQAYTERAFYQWLKDHNGERGTVATGLIGSTGYWSEARVIDVFGIIDPVTAHMPARNWEKAWPATKNEPSARTSWARRRTSSFRATTIRDTGTTATTSTPKFRRGLKGFGAETSCPRPAASFARRCSASTPAARWHGGPKVPLSKPFPVAGHPGASRR